MVNEKLDNEISLDEFVSQMMEEQNHNPKDYCFRYMVDVYPRESHEILNFPGSYVNKIKRMVYTEDGRNLEMDCAQLIMPEGEITCKSTINVEHQSTLPSKNKIDTIYDYKIGLIHETNLPSNSIIITHINPGKDKIWKKSHDQVYYNHYIVIDDEDISKRLKRLTNIIENNNDLSITNALNFAVIAIFVEGKQKKKIMEKLVQLFTKIQIDSTLQINLHHILKKMIKKHFENDKNKCKEMLTMISESIFGTNYEGLTCKEIDELRIKEKEEEIEHYKQQIEQKDKQYKQQIEQKDQEIEQKDQEIENLKKQLKN